jgi:NAD(P)-dependent dehydrogenase (short-subunit alcohol dehydrogenase family)
VAAERTPTRAMVTIEDVGMATGFLATDYARLITGDTMYIDGGYPILGWPSRAVVDRVARGDQEDPGPLRFDSTVGTRRP